MIHGLPGDPRAAWLIALGDGNRVDLTWPPGYSAQFDPGLRVFDQEGAEVLAAGDYVDATCAIGDPLGRLMAPPFLALRLDCGPMRLDECAVAVRDVATASGWPSTPIESVRFRSSDGEYVVRLEDGNRVEGHWSPR